MDNNKDVQFLQKLSSFPEEVYLYFSSEINGKINKELARDYGLSSDFVYDLVSDFFISEFDLDLLKRNVLEKIENKNQLDDFISDFFGKLFFPIEPFLPSKIEKIIKDLKIKTNNYNKYLDEINDLIDDKNFENLDDLAESFSEIFNEDEEEKIVLHILGKDLVDVLKNNDSKGIQNINGSIFYLLNNKKGIQNKLVRVLLSNSEKISTSDTVLKNKKQEGTVANWIKHFIDENGSDIFSSILLAKYLSISLAQFSLDDEEKRVLRRALKLYKNLVFYPDSMKDIPVENWEIIPIEENVFVDSNNTLDSKKQKIKKETASKQEDSIEVKEKKIEEEIKEKEEKKIDLKASNTKLNQIKEIEPEHNLEKQELEVLQEMLEKYPEKSLERKAVESEIKKRNK